MHLIISSSLHPTSRSRILAGEVARRLEAAEAGVEWFDLAERSLPMCDGATAYGDAEVGTLSELIEQADAIFVAAPVYNYDVNAALKNAIELTGKAWTGKVVAMLLAAGGRGSYMSGMGLANSLMLDFRCWIVPRFVYATGESFEGDALADEDVDRRIDQLIAETLRVSLALRDRATDQD